MQGRIRTGRATCEPSFFFINVQLKKNKVMTIEMINEKFGRMCRGLLKRRWIALGAFVVILFVGMIGMKKIKQ